MKRKDADRGAHEIPLPPVLLRHSERVEESTATTPACLPCPAGRRAADHAEGVEKFYRDVLGLAGKHSPHSWRSAFSTVAREAGK